MAQQYGLPRKEDDNKPGPRAFVVHHTGGGSSAKNIVDYWRSNRPGIGTQYIMDRDGVIHSVKDEFGYSGTSHVSGAHTPQGLKAKGLTNKNMLGMEIMAKNDKDVTPQQAKAFAEFMQKNHPDLPIYGHGELNPGHREKDEGQTAKAAAMALRNGGAATAGTAVPEVQAGAGPAAVAAARAADTASAPAAKTATAISSADDPRGMATHIRQTAAKYGVDPEVALRVAKSEGLSTFLGDNGKSGGAFQLYTGGGVGNEFQKETGLDPLDPKNEKATIDYALKRASQVGWSPWHGATKAGIGEREGIGGTPKTEPLDPTPNVGAGQGAYDDQAQVAAAKNMVDPTPNVGSGASGYAPADTSVSTSDAADTVSGKPHNYGKDVGDIFSGLGDIFSKGPVAQNAARPSGPANVPGSGTMPIPQGPVPMVDPRMADAQRQQLAMALQRLNSRKLV